MEKSNLISLIVPVYNAEKYLNECVQSVIKQSFKTWELLLIDDGSVDNSGIICDRFANADNRIKVIHKQNGGVSVARNVGLENAKGEYITFLDADDTIAEFYLENLTKEAPNADLVCCGYRLYGQYNKEDCPLNMVMIEIKKGFAREFNDYCTNLYFVASWGKLYNKKLLCEMKLLFDTKMHLAEDTLFTLSYILHCNKIIIVPYVGYEYRYNQGITKYNMHFVDYHHHQQQIDKVVSDLENRFGNNLLNLRNMAALQTSFLGTMKRIESRRIFCNESLQYRAVYGYGFKSMTEKATLFWKFIFRFPSIGYYVLKFRSIINR